MEFAADNNCSRELTWTASSASKEKSSGGFKIEEPPIVYKKKIFKIWAVKTNRMHCDEGSSCSSNYFSEIIYQNVTFKFWLWTSMYLETYANMNSFSSSKHAVHGNVTHSSFNVYALTVMGVSPSSLQDNVPAHGWFTDCMNNLVSSGRRVQHYSYHLVPPQGSNRRTWTPASSTLHVAAFECSSGTNPWLFHEEAPTSSGFNCAHASF